MHTLHISLLGDFHLVHGTELLTSVNTPRLQALLAYLVIHRQAPQPRQHIAFQFWPDSSEKQAHTNLRKLLFQLRNALPEPDRFLMHDYRSIHWRPDAPYTLDVADLQATLARCITPDGKPLVHARQDDLAQVVNRYQGELLPGCFDEWLLPLRQGLQRAVMVTIEQLTTLLEYQRAYRAGIDYARRLLALDPLEEKSYQRLMRLHVLDGDYPSALRVYQACAATLRRELDVAPDAETQALYERLHRRDSTLVAKAEPNLSPPARLPLVGRQREWESIQSAWRQAAQGSAHFVCIWGEAGMGKTRLAEELLHWADHQGILTARTRSYQAQGALAYTPLTTLLRSPALFSRLGNLGKNWLSEVARLLPELLEQHPGLPAPQPMTESWQRQRFFEALARALLTDEQPLLLLFDDLHWCDHETLGWLRYLIHFAPQARLLVVGASRIEEVDDAHPLTALRLGLRFETAITEIELSPLSSAEVTALIHTLVDQKLTGEQAQQIYTDTEGNPLFVVETVRARQDAVHQGESSVMVAPTALSPSLIALSKLPSKVHAVIRARLTQLSPATQKIARVAATIGRSFSFAVLLAAASVAEEVLIDSLDELVARRILREQGMDSYDFSHDRIRDVAYAELSNARRRQLHRHVATALAEVHKSNLDEISGLLAEHYEQAGNVDQALHHLQRAGEQAAQVSAHREALIFYHRAVHLVTNAEKGVAAHTQLLRSNLLIKLAHSYVALDEYATAQQVAEEGLALARASGEQRSLADSLSVFGSIALALSNYARATSLYQQALELYQVIGNRRKEGDVLHQLGVIAYGQGEYTQATQLDEQALLIAREIGDRKGEVQALLGLGYIIRMRGNPEKAEQLHQQALLVYRAIGDRLGEARTLNVLGIEAVAQAYYAQATQRQKEALLIYQEIGARKYEARTLSYLAEIAWWQDEYNEAASIEGQALLICRHIGDRDGEAFALFGLALTAHNQGEYTQAIPLYEQALLIYQDIGNQSLMAAMFNAMGNLAYFQGRYTQASELLQQALPIIHNTNNRSQKAYALLVMGFIAQAHGEYAQATDLYLQAWAICRDIGERKKEAQTLTCLGNVAYVCGKYGEANQRHQQAMTMAETIGDRRGIMRALKGLGWVAWAQGEYGEAVSLLQQALTLAQAIGDRSEQAGIFHALGYTAWSQQKLQTAHQHFYMAITISQDVGLTPVLLASLVGVAQLFTHEGQPAAALPLIGLALRSAQSTAETKQHAERLLATVRIEMPSESADALWAASEQLQLVQVVQAILQTTV